MSVLLQPYLLLLILSTGISAVLTIMALKYRPTLGTRSFAALMSAVALWSFVAAFEVGSGDPLTKKFSYSLKYLFIVVVPVAWLIFGLYYSNRLRTLQFRLLCALLALPAITLVMVATNGFHHLMFDATRWYQTRSYFILLREFGPWFWVHVAYSYGLLIAGFIFLAKSLIDSPAPYRSQVVLLLIGGLAPWLCNLIFLLDLGPMSYLDSTPFAFAVSGTAFMLGLVRFRLLDIVPVARDVVFQSMQDGVIVVDNDIRILDLNPAAARLVGKPLRDLIGTKAEAAIAWWPQLPDPSGTENYAVIEIKCKDLPQLFRVRYSTIQCKDKAMGRLIALQDITAAKMAEEALKVSETRFRSLTENAPVIIFTIDHYGRITYTNPACTKILGYERPQVVGRSFREFIAEEATDSAPLETFKRLVEGHQATAEINIHFLHKDGDKRLCNAVMAANSDAEGRVTGIIGMAKDITEEISLQHQFFQAQKMEAIGTLAGGIAHDFNNLLMGMQANISLMRLEAKLPAPVQDKLNRVEDQIQSGATLTRQLLGYARKGKYVVTTIDLRRLLQESLDMVQRTNKGITTRCHFSNEPTFLEADRGQIELVLLNLFVNAVAAMPKGGELIITTTIVHLHESSRRWSDAKPGRYVELKVGDTGTGMDKATMGRIFEPFFTTKEIGQGTGLGLASVYGVVTNHGGHIRVDSKPSEGTTFTMLFPASDRSIEALTSGPPVVRLPMRRGRILLVDDEALILQYCGEMIESLGFTVLGAESGHEALRIYEGEHTRIELVILDLVMPTMDGHQLFEALKKINPKVKVLLSSGFSLDTRAEQILSQGPHGWLKKPYNRDQLARAMAALLASGFQSRKMDSAATLAL
jgi:two-component system, cell cycle sensor histidine kinase and response regulator CckA